LPPSVPPVPASDHEPTFVAAESAEAAVGEGVNTQAEANFEDGCVDELDAWLLRIDRDGTLAHYGPALHREFANLSELAAALVQPRASRSKSVLSWVEPSVFEALGVRSLGHKLLIARGIAALSDARLAPEV